jgi:hypothetical protein
MFHPLASPELIAKGYEVVPVAEGLLINATDYNAQEALIPWDLIVALFTQAVGPSRAADALAPRATPEAVANEAPAPVSGNSRQSPASTDVLTHETHETTSH